VPPAKVLYSGRSFLAFLAGQNGNLKKNISRTNSLFYFWRPRWRSKKMFYNIGSWPHWSVSASGWASWLSGSTPAVQNLIQTSTTWTRSCPTAFIQSSGRRTSTEPSKSGISATKRGSSPSSLPYTILNFRLFQLSCWLPGSNAIKPLVSVVDAAGE